MKLNDLTWPEIQEYLKKDQRLIIPAGTCEQHGPHLPLKTDTFTAEKIADEISSKKGILVAPTINYGVNFPSDNKRFGTTGVTEETLKNYVKPILECWKSQGFEKFYVLSAHGVPEHLKALMESDPSSVTLIDLYDVDLKDILEKQERCEHACEAETSVILYLDPFSVRKDRIVDVPLEEDEEHESEAVDLNTPGNEGYPSLATPKKGELIFKKMLENAVKIISSDQKVL